VSRQTLLLGVAALGVSMRCSQWGANVWRKRTLGFGSEPSAVTPPEQLLEYQSGARWLTTVGSPALHQLYFDPSPTAVIPHNPPTFQPPGSPTHTCAFMSTLLEWASLRGPCALLDSSLLSLLCAMRCHLQLWPVPGPKHCVESLLCRLATIWRCAYATRGNAFADRHAPE
jgi:hypothetical protein